LKFTGKGEWKERGRGGMGREERKGERTGGVREGGGDSRRGEESRGGDGGGGGKEKKVEEEVITK
jgi:hypothetical protein